MGNDESFFVGGSMSSDEEDETLFFGGCTTTIRQLSSNVEDYEETKWSEEINFEEDEEEMRVKRSWKIDEIMEQEKKLRRMRSR